MCGLLSPPILTATAPPVALLRAGDPQDAVVAHGVLPGRRMALAVVSNSRLPHVTGNLWPPLPNPREPPAMEDESPVEKVQEDLHEHAHASRERWVMGVAMTAAVLAALAAVA